MLAEDLTELSRRLHLHGKRAGLEVRDQKVNSLSKCLSSTVVHGKVPLGS